ncbi:MAG: hypothetical protein NTX86_00775 [Candidatus Dependentiae bacterium]|nr:hypothetical protein [Candidatus Dependentiae bacterium]
MKNISPKHVLAFSIAMISLAFCAPQAQAVVIKPATKAPVVKKTAAELAAKKELERLKKEQDKLVKDFTTQFNNTMKSFESQLKIATYPSPLKEAAKDALAKFKNAQPEIKAFIIEFIKFPTSQWEKKFKAMVPDMKAFLPAIQKIYDLSQTMAEKIQRNAETPQNRAALKNLHVAIMTTFPILGLWIMAQFEFSDFRNAFSQRLEQLKPLIDNAFPEYMNQPAPIVITE